MSTIYLIDSHTTPVLSSPINDVRYTNASGQVPMTGNFPIRIADDLSVEPPTDLSDLLAKKEAAVAAKYPTFSRNYFDHLLGTSGLIVTQSIGRVLGSRQTTQFGALNAVLQTQTIAVGAPDIESILVLWETHTVEYNDDPKTGLLTRTYQEGGGIDITGEVSVNGGSNYFPVTNGIPISIPLANQGQNLIVRLTAASSGIPTNLHSITALFN